MIPGRAEAGILAEIGPEGVGVIILISFLAVFIGVIVMAVVYEPRLVAEQGHTLLTSFLAPFYDIGSGIANGFNNIVTAIGNWLTGIIVKPIENFFTNLWNWLTSNL